MCNAHYWYTLITYSDVQTGKVVVNSECFGRRKGKKEGKQDSKDKESDIEKAKANAALWELRLQATDLSLGQYREASRRLARANEELTNQLYRQERDAIDVTGYLKRQDAAKEDKVCV